MLGPPRDQYIIAHGETRARAFLRLQQHGDFDRICEPDSIFARAAEIDDIAHTPGEAVFHCGFDRSWLGKADALWADGNDTLLPRCQTALTASAQPCISHSKCAESVSEFRHDTAKKVGLANKVGDESAGRALAKFLGRTQLLDATVIEDGD